MTPEQIKELNLDIAEKLGYGIFENYPGQLRKGGIKIPDFYKDFTEAQALRDEIERLKTGIKTLNLTMDVDGNDMIDWGWTTIKSKNLAVAKVLAGENPDGGLQPFPTAGLT